MQKVKEDFKTYKKKNKKKKETSMLQLNAKQLNLQFLK